MIERIVIKFVGYHWQKALAGEVSWSDVMLVICAQDDGLWSISQQIHTPEYQLIRDVLEELNFLFLVANQQEAL